MKRSISVLVTLTLLVPALAVALPAQAKDKTTIGHNPDTPDQKTMRVSDHALPGHLAHGDTLGACDQPSPPPDAPPSDGLEKVMICHKPGTPAEKTLEIPSEDVPDHVAHGDRLGACEQTSPPYDEGKKVMVCHKPGTPAEKTLEIASAAVPAHLGHGDYLGSCGEPPPSTEPDSTGVAKVTICHKPGTPAEKTMHVPVQALGGHLGHGDNLGTCDRQTLAPVTAGLTSASCVWVRYVSLPRGPRRPLPC
jgi:hypothetical protein